MSASCLHATEMLEADPWYRQCHLRMKEILMSACSIKSCMFMAAPASVIVVFTIVITIVITTVVDWCLKMIMVELLPKSAQIIVILLLSVLTVWLMITVGIYVLVNRHENKSCARTALDVLAFCFNAGYLPPFLAAAAAAVIVTQIATWGFIMVCLFVHLPYYVTLVLYFCCLYHQNIVTHWFRVWITRALNLVMPLETTFQQYIQRLRHTGDDMLPLTMSSPLFDGRIGNGYLSMLADACTEDTEEQFLDLYGQVFDGYGVEKLAKVLNGQNATIQYLNLAHNRIGYRGAKAIAHLLQSPKCMLKMLNLSQCGFGLKGSRLLVESICNNKILVDLDISENQMSDGKLLGEVLKNNTKLHKIDLSSNYLGDRGIIDLVQGMEGNHALKELNVSRNQIGPNGVQALLPLISQLKALILHGNLLGDEGTILLAESLTTKNELELLNVRFSFDNSYAGSVLEFLRICKPIDITAESGKAFLECLEVNHTLKNLILHFSVDDALTKEIGREIDDALRRNRGDRAIFVPV